MQPQGYALITGASSGIGEEFARQFAAQGMVSDSGCALAGSSWKKFEAN